MPIIQLENFVLGGIADSKYLGTPNSSYKMFGLDIHSEPGIVKINQKLTKESSDFVDDFVRVIVPCSDGNTYLFGSTNGKIWKRTSAGVYTLEATASPAAGTAGILDAKEYDGYIYYAMQSRLGRWQLGTAWSARNDSWATFTKTNANFHPMIILNLVLYIGDGNLVAQVDAGVFSANALNFDLLSEQQVSALGKYITDVLAGVFKGENINESTGYRWNTWSDSFSSDDDVPERGINAYLKTDNFTLAQVGRKGNLYFFDGAQYQQERRIPGDWTGTNEAKVFSNAAINKFGLPFFGISNMSGNPCEQGVYSLGKYSKNYPAVLNLEYVISTGHTSNVQIGAIALVGNDMLVSWKDTTTGTLYGVDKLDTTAKYASAALETRVIASDRKDNKTMGVWVNYRTMPTNCNVTIKASVNDAAYGSALTTKNDTDRKFIYTEIKVPPAVKAQFRFDVVVSGNDAPEIESIIIDYV